MRKRNLTASIAYAKYNIPYHIKEYGNLDDLRIYKLVKARERSNDHTECVVLVYQREKREP
jgi:hypothetical protein